MAKRRRKRVVMVRPHLYSCRWYIDGTFDLVFKSSTSLTDKTVKLEGMSYVTFSNMLRTQHRYAECMEQAAKERAERLRKAIESGCNDDAKD